MSEGDKKTEEKKPGPNVKVIYWTVFLDFFASGVVLPLLQQHAKSELGGSGYNVGMVFTAYSAASIPGSFMLGRVSDFIGRRPVILVSLFMSVVTLYMTAIAPDLDSLIMARAIAGFFSETSVCQAYIADKTTKEERPKYLGHMGAFIGLGFMVGPATGALLGVFGGFSVAAYFTTAVTALNFVYALRSLDEPEKQNSEKEEVGWGLYFKTLLRPSMIIILLSQFASTFAFMGWDTTFGIWSAERLGYERRHVGWAFAWLAMSLILAMWKMRSKITNNPQHIMRASVVGNLMMAFSLVAHQYIYSTWAIFIPLFLLGFGYGVTDLVYQTLVSSSAGAGLQGSMLGTLGAVQALARAVSPVATGYLFDNPENDLNIPYNTLAILPLVAVPLIPLFCSAPPPKPKDQ
eukprot:TRINITY_DN2297_c2_g1_i2.p1 TRINITY_DN2297_c2_g1~~TRINITY_DN2297_c2_g1_i2.p1  ORF type:complete len:428 (+),score=52.74 TRINITY_DN2297_c2_g1_i2:72-1286(+)